jgi:hypothetical protein
LEGKATVPRLRYQSVADTVRGEVRLIHADDVNDRLQQRQQTIGEGRCSGNSTIGEPKPSRKPIVFVKTVHLNVKRRTDRGASNRPHGLQQSSRS